ncbi:MAG TPA: phage tail tube protein [Bradyrhizobium sp.]|nr:phage tail tube protein [Bradyrhizobium sp.]
MGDTTNRVAGIATMAIDGQSYAVAGQVRYSPSTVTREPMVGQDGPHGYKEMPVMPYIAVSLRDTGGLSVASINAITNSTIVLGLANGKTVIGRNMFAVDTQEVDTEEAKLEAKFNGFDVSEN